MFDLDLKCGSLMSSCVTVVFEAELHILCGGVVVVVDGCAIVVGGRCDVDMWNI